MTDGYLKIPFDSVLEHLYMRDLLYIIFFSEDASGTLFSLMYKHCI